MMSASSIARFAQALALAGLAAGCSTLPRQRPETPPLPAQWTEAATTSEETALIDWWRAFNDPLLDRLVAEGLTRGPSVREAMLRVRQARAEAHQTLGAYAPQISGEASGQYTHAIQGPPLIGANGAEGEQGIGSFGAAVSWEIPLLSRIRNAAVGARANSRSALADARGAQVALAADLAQAYVDLRAAQNQRAAFIEAAQIGQQLANILGISAKAGFASAADAADARRQAELSASRIPDAEVAARGAMNRIAVLRAHAPGTEEKDVSSALGVLQPVPSVDLKGAPAAPADLIRLRPDIAAAEAQAMLAAAQVGVARDDLLPHLSLTGSILASDNLLGSALGAAATTSTLAPLVTMPLLDWGTHFAAVRAKKAQFERALVAYEDTVNRGVAEASNALTQLDQGASRLRSARAAEADAEITARGTRASYGVGIASLTDRLLADQKLLDARLSRIQAESQAAGGAIAVYRAFGGGPPPLGGTAKS